MHHAVDFHGVRRREASPSGFTFTEAVYRSDDSLPMHAHAHPFFALLVSGSYTESLERGARRCMPSSLAFYPAGIPHADHFEGRGGRAFLVEFRADELEGIEAYGADDVRHLGEIRNERLNQLALRLYASFVSEGGPGTSVEEELGLEMIAELRSLALGEERRPPRWLQSVVDRIHADFRSTVRISALAESVGVHPVHLSRVFRRHHGCLIGEYVERLRVQHACHALASSDVALADLAVHLGYADQAHFTRRFGRAVGTPPGRFRSRASR